MDLIGLIGVTNMVIQYLHQAHMLRVLMASLSSSPCFSNSDTAPLLNNSTQDRMFETMSGEIEQLLAKVRLNTK